MIEKVPKSKMSKGRRKPINERIEVISKGEMCEGGWKGCVCYWSVEVLAKGNVGDWRIEIDQGSDF